MVEQFIELLKEINIAQIFVIFAGGYFFYDKMDKKMEGRFEKIDNRLTRLENDMIEVKTILRMKECCILNDDRQAKKVE